MKKSFKRQGEGLKSVFLTLRGLPKLVWVCVVLAFILGFLIRGSGGGHTPDNMGAGEHVHDEQEVEWWTCSMHPQIKLQEPGQCPICFMDLIPMETEDTGDSPYELKMSPTAMKLAEIATARVYRSDAKTEIRLSGKVEYDERRLGKITAWVPGRLEKLYVDYTGVSVKKGEPLVELYSPSLYAAQEELLQARKYTLRAESVLAKESAKMISEAAEEKLRQLGLTDAQIDEIQNRGSATNRVMIYSPMSGVVVHKNAMEGLYVQRGTQIYAIADLTKIWVVLDAYESDLPWLQEGQRVEFQVEAVPGVTFLGNVGFVDPILNDKTRTVQVRVDIDNTEGLLKPGMFVRATVHSQLTKAADGRQPLLIPATAVLRTGERAVVYVKKPDTEEPVFEGREVVLGSRAGRNYIVVFGLNEGEEVVIKGNFKIDSAMQIAARPSMMNPEGGVAMTGHEHHGESATPPETMMKMDEEQLELDVSFLKMLTPVYQTYFSAQAALADDDFETTQTGLADLDKKVMAIDVTGLKGESSIFWSTIKNALHENAQHAQHWSEIEAARRAFEPISMAILNLEKIFGHTGDETHYRVFCPMAFDDKGAPWLQNHDTVDNPYFGAAMLLCGEVQEVFESKK